MTSKPTLPDSDSQADRFTRVARALGADDDPKALDRLFGNLVARITPVDRETGMSDERISEQMIADEALRILAFAKDGFMTTTDLKDALEKHFTPEGKDAEILDGRSDTRFSQKVRNLVSHRATGTGLEANGLAVYEASRHGFTITEDGRKHI